MYARMEINMSSELAIEHLCKEYSSFRLDDISFAVEN